MPRKKVVRQPIEKLKDEAIVIEDSSSDEEEIDLAPPPTPVEPKNTEKPKRQRSAKQLANDQRLRERAAARKKAKSDAPVEEPKVEMPEPVAEPVAEPEKPKPKRGRPKKVVIKEEPKSVAEEDPDDKPLTKKQMMELLSAHKQTAPVDKPKRGRPKGSTAPKKVAPTPPPTPQPQQPQYVKPQMMWV